MSTISEIQIIQEFTNDDRTYGVYSALFKGERKVFIRNNHSVGVVTFLLDKTASQSVCEIRDDVKAELFAQLFLSKIKKECCGCEHWGGSDCTLVAPDTGCVKTVNLCDTCSKCFADCGNGEEGEDFFFGIGLGYDNVYKCKSHEPIKTDDSAKTEVT